MNESTEDKQMIVADIVILEYPKQNKVVLTSNLKRGLEYPECKAVATTTGFDIVKIATGVIVVSYKNIRISYFNGEAFENGARGVILNFTKQ